MRARRRRCPCDAVVRCAHLGPSPSPYLLLFVRHGGLSPAGLPGTSPRRAARAQVPSCQGTYDFLIIWIWFNAQNKAPFHWTYPSEVMGPVVTVGDCARD